jgi:hypothetical protein
MTRIDLNRSGAGRGRLREPRMPRQRLFRDLLWVTFVKLVALTAIYFLFFGSPARIDAANHLLLDTATAGPSR